MKLYALQCYCCSIIVIISYYTLVRLIMTGNIVAGKNMAVCQSIFMQYTMSELQKLTWRVLLWRVEMKIWWNFWKTGKFNLAIIKQTKVITFSDYTISSFSKWCNCFNFINYLQPLFVVISLSAGCLVLS